MNGTNNFSGVYVDSIDQPTLLSQSLSIHSSQALKCGCSKIFNGLRMTVNYNLKNASVAYG